MPRPGPRQSGERLTSRRSRQLQPPLDVHVEHPHGEPPAGAKGSVYSAYSHGPSTAMISASEVVPRPQGYIMQMLAAKLGVATGKHLAEHCRHGAVPLCTCEILRMQLRQIIEPTCSTRQCLQTCTAVVAQERIPAGAAVRAVAHGGDRHHWQRHSGGHRLRHRHHAAQPRFYTHLGRHVLSCRHHVPSRDHMLGRRPCQHIQYAS